MARTEKYTDNDLLQAINEYIIKNPNKPLSYAALGRETDIPEHVYKRRMKDFVEEYNEGLELKAPKVNANNIIFPSVDDVILMCKNNPKNSRVLIETLLSQAEENMQRASYKKQMEEMEKTHKLEVHKYEMQIKELTQEVKNLEHMLSLIMINSAYPDKRKEQGIKSNIIEFSRENEKKYNDMLKNLEL